MDYSLLHKKQKEAVDFVLESIDNGKEIIAITGAGGTGKSEIMSVIKEKLYENDIPVVFSATTNKAAARLREAVNDAKTIHSAVAMPIFRKCYNDLSDFYELYVKGYDDEGNKVELSKTEKEQVLNGLYKNSCKETKDFIAKYNIKAEKFDSINELMHYLKIQAFDPEIFSHYSLKTDEVDEFGVVIPEKKIPDNIIIDEASMLPTKSEYNDKSLVTIGLDSVKKVYKNVVLVGDSSQLPPINSTSSFEGIETIELTKNFRSQKDLLRAIQHARDGLSFWDYEQLENENVKVVNSITDSWYKGTFMKDNVAHIAYTNKTRRDIVIKIRGERKQPQIGEPLLWRGKNKEHLHKGDIGKFKGNIVEFEYHNEKIWRDIYLDEYDDKYCVYQYGYCMTAHMAQGSSLDHVIVHMYDIPGFIQQEERRKWIYTAVSRAKKSLTIIL